MNSDAEVLIARADKLLDSPDRTALGNSARLAAFLARQAVEDLIDARCAELTGVQIVVGTLKAKLAVLKSLDKTPAGPALIDAWHQLTGFCHHHAYQLCRPCRRCGRNVPRSSGPASADCPDSPQIPRLAIRSCRDRLPKRPKLTTQLVGAAGEHFVAAEIHPRGGYAATFSGNMLGIDLLSATPLNIADQHPGEDLDGRYMADDHQESG